MIIKGNAADANADFLRGGYEEVIGEAVTAGDITIVGETYTDNWDPAHRPDPHGAVPHRANNDVAGGARRERRHGRRRRRRARGPGPRRTGPGVRPGRRPGRPQPRRPRHADRDVWKDARELGTAAGEAAIALCANPTSPPSRARRRSRRREATSVTSILLEPIPITQDNLDVVLDAGWIDQETLCQGVEAGAVAACALRPAVGATRPAACRPAAAGTEAMGTAPATTEADSRPHRRRTCADALTQGAAMATMTLKSTRRRPAGGTPSAWRGLWTSTEIDVRLFGMVVALAVIWIGFHIAVGRRLPDRPQPWNLSVQSVVDRHHGDGHGADHRVAQHRPVGRLAARVPRLHDGDGPDRVDPQHVRPRVRPLVHVDRRPRRRPSPSARRSAASRASSSPTSACRRSSSRSAGSSSGAA